jgi:hypothetical protein
MMPFASCLIGSSYGMSADIYNQTVTQDPKSKATTKAWTLSHTINCDARSIVTDAVSDDGSGKDFRQEYREHEFIKIITGERLNKRQRVTNIRDKNNNLLWINDERDGDPTIFEVQGVTPRLDPWQSIIDYEVLLKRVEVQNG